MASSDDEGLRARNTEGTAEGTADKPKAKHTQTDSFIFKHFLHRDARLGKLVSKEDKFHIHKALGILSVVSFLYRYGSVYPRTGTLGFRGSRLDWATILVHTMLACSSLVFRVPRKRLKKNPLMIYEEYRQHAILFTVRSFSVCALAMMLPVQSAFVAPILVMAHHLFADRITAIHGNGNTSVRSDGKKVQQSIVFKFVGWFYSLYQFMLIGSLIDNNARAADLGYNGIIAIQSSAFLMTLYRKRIIRGKTHLGVYSACLLLSWFHIARVVGFEVCLLIVSTFALRVSLPRAYSNKYVLWTLFLTAKYRAEIQEAFASGETSTGLLALAVAVAVYGGFRAERKFASLLVKLPSGAILDASRQGS